MIRTVIRTVASWLKHQLNHCDTLSESLHAANSTCGQAAAALCYILDTVTLQTANSRIAADPAALGPKAQCEWLLL